MLQKPSRIHNITYLILGYYLSSVFTYRLNLPFDQKVFFIIAFGSFIGTLIYYIKPVERTIMLYFKLSKTNLTYPEPPYDELATPVYKSEILLSNYLQDERTIINGAFFMAIGIITSYNPLELAGFSDLYFWLQILTAILFCIAIWEIYVLIKKKIPIIQFFYNYYNVSRNIPTLEKAIQKKDWIEANKIIDKEPELTDPELRDYMPIEEMLPVGVCTICQKIRVGKYCQECGGEIKRYCSKCQGNLIKKDDETCPKFCRYCGEKIQ